jgi:hypothetical protein
MDNWIKILFSIVITISVLFIFVIMINLMAISNSF